MHEDTSTNVAILLLIIVSNDASARPWSRKCYGGIAGCTLLGSGADIEVGVELRAEGENRGRWGKSWWFSRIRRNYRRGTVMAVGA